MTEDEFWTRIDNVDTNAFWAATNALCALTGSDPEDEEWDYLTAVSHGRIWLFPAVGGAARIPADETW